MEVISSRSTHAATAVALSCGTRTDPTPAKSAASGPTMRTFVMVMGRQTPVRVPGAKSGIFERYAAGNATLCWLCTISFGLVVVPLVFMITAGAKGSTDPTGVGSTDTDLSWDSQEFSDSPF